ncbi:haloacid dehalogenase-like hydrolase domain-containing protein 2 isoform X3 [Branchiostoma floridae x Branchiostoma japonicum]
MLTRARCLMTTTGRLSAVLVDLSGTLHVEDTVIPGAVEALRRLRQCPLKVKFVTNTTKESKQMLVDRLQKLGFDIQPEEVFTSLTAARNLVEELKVRPMLFLQDSALPDFEGIDTTNPNAVVIGLAPDKFNYRPLNYAFRLLLEGAPLIAIHKARYYKKSDGLSLGPGPFVTGLEYATDVTATVVGKPETTFFREAVKTLGCSPEDALMIGDVNTDQEMKRRSTPLPPQCVTVSQRRYTTFATKY